MSEADELAEKCEAAFTRGLAIGFSIGSFFLLMAIVYNYLFGECPI